MAYKNKSYNFVLRLITACILAPIVISVIKMSGFYFTSMILLAAIIMGGEWYYMTQDQKNLFRTLGALYIFLACLSLLWIIKQHYLVNNTIKLSGVNTVISIFVLVWANDIGGYLFGRLFGGPRLCP